MFGYETKTPDSRALKKARGGDIMDAASP